MRALNTLHAALRASGVLLDVRPAPEHPWLEIQRRAETVRIGQLDDSYRHTTLAAASSAIAPFVETCRLVRERATTFTFIYHYDSVDAWLAYMAEHWHTARIPAELVACARAIFEPGAGEVRILRAINAARYRRGWNSAKGDGDRAAARLRARQSAPATISNL